MRIFRSCFYFFSLYSRAVFQGYFTNKRNMNKLELHSFEMVAFGSVKPRGVDMNFSDEIFVDNHIPDFSVKG